MDQDLKTRIESIKRSIDETIEDAETVIERCKKFIEEIQSVESVEEAREVCHRNAELLCNAEYKHLDVF